MSVAAAANRVVAPFELLGIRRTGVDVRPLALWVRLELASKAWGDAA